MRDQEPQRGELVFHRSVKPKKDADDLFGRIDELKALVEKVHDLAAGLEQIECGLEIKLGDSRAAKLFATLMGVDEHEAYSQASTSEETGLATYEPDDAPGDAGLPFHEDLVQLPRLNLAALRYQGKLEYLDDFDLDRLLRQRLNPLYNNSIEDQFLWLVEGTITELMIRIFLGNSEERLDIHDFLIIFRQLFRKDRIKGKLMSIDRRAIGRRMRKLLSAGFVVEVAPAKGVYGAVYMLNPDMDPTHPYVRRYFYGRIDARLHKTTARKPRKKRGRKKKVTTPAKPPKPRFSY